METRCVGRLWPATAAGIAAAFDTLRALPSPMRRRVRMLAVLSPRTMHFRLGLCVLADTDTLLEPTAFEWDGGIST